MEPGERLGPYEIVAFIGAGGMGEVWRARDTRLEREVALKVLPASTLADPTARARLLREARMASQLNHPNVCTIHEVGESDGRAYIAMELVEGRSLASLLAGGGLPAEQVLKLGLQLADALAHAHERGVVHRDLKSGNVNVTLEGRVKVLDFGLAKRLASEDLAKATTLTQASLTEAGAIVGTLAYMAPEQLRGEGADARSDVWALGVVLYEMAAGRRPFRGDTSYELSSAILSQPPAPLPATVPGPLAAVIERCLGKAPAQRYQRGGEVRAALEAVASGETLPPWPALRAWVVCHRRPTLLTCASALLAVLVATRRRRRAEPSAREDPAGAPAIRMAVLPFANLSGDPQQDYLSDGLTQEMIAQLGRLHPETLSVIARTSVMRYKKTETPIDQIGKELGVRVRARGERAEGGLAGSGCRRSSSRCRARRSSGRTVYERELSGDPRAAERRRPQGRLGAGAQAAACRASARLANIRTVNPEAYELYLRGSQQRDTLTAAGFDAAQRYFELALAKDPDFALAYAGIANVWACRQQMEITPPREAGPKAKAAALRAMALDDTIAAVHASMGGILAWVDWDWVGAERELRRAIEAGPDTMGARAMYSHVLMILGRRDEAMRQIERAVELDPFNVLTLSFYTFNLYCDRRYDETIAQARKALSMQPDMSGALSGLMLALHETKQHDEMIAAAKKLYAGWYPDVGQALDQAYAGRDYPGAWRRAGEFEAAKHGDDTGAAYDIAQVALYAGDTARALDWLEKACDDRDPNLPYISCEPLFDSLRSEPRFQALLRRMNLPVPAPADAPAPAGASRVTLASGTPPRSLRDRSPSRRRRHGRGLQGARPPARA